MESLLEGLLLTHRCNLSDPKLIGTEVTLCGWVTKSRDLGGLLFIDLRDKYGVMQLGFEQFEGDRESVGKISLESVVRAKGVFSERPASAQNSDMETGKVEVQVKEIEVLSEAQSPPFLPHGKVGASETLRLKHRYLDLRGNRLQEILKERSAAANRVRGTLLGEEFVEVETPILYKSTPEGARDYLVPSRVHPGSVYALPQSPQTLKQLLMIGGTNKYFQICKCFRDEDLRADRQPEFTQIDIEVSFATSTYIKNLARKVVASVYGLDESFTMTELTYYQAMETYGSDKPDLRFGLEHKNVTELFKTSEFSTFKTVAESNGLIKALFIKEELGTFSRKIVDGLTELVKQNKGKGLAWFKNTSEGLSGGISKFISDDILKALNATLGSDEGEKGTWFFFADNDHEVVHACADVIRRHFGKELNLIGSEHAFAWISDFPLLEYDKDSERFFAKHHPFTMPHSEDLAGFLSKDPAVDKEFFQKCRAEAYDLVCNGYELGGGSVRIHRQDIQKQMFKALGMDEEEVKHQFGFFVEALNYGTPPHAGIAFGFDRMVMVLVGTDSISDVIAFPKTTSASDLMSGCPSVPANEQLQELHLNWVKKP